MTFKADATSTRVTATRCRCVHAGRAVVAASAVSGRCAESVRLTVRASVTLRALALVTQARDGVVRAARARLQVSAGVLGAVVAGRARVGTVAIDTVETRWTVVTIRRTRVIGVRAVSAEQVIRRASGAVRARRADVARVAVHGRGRAGAEHTVEALHAVTSHRRQTSRVAVLASVAR